MGVSERDCCSELNSEDEEDNGESRFGVSHQLSDLQENMFVSAI